MTKEGKACNPLFESKILGWCCLEHVQWQVEKTSGPGSTRRSRSRPVEAGVETHRVSNRPCGKGLNRVDELPFFRIRNVLRVDFLFFLIHEIQAFPVHCLARKPL